MKTNPRSFIPGDPQLFEPLAIEMREALLDAFSWLSEAYLFAEHQQRKDVDGRAEEYPATLAGAEEYISLFPDTHLGSFSYFDISEDDNVDHLHGSAKVTKEVGLVLFFDYRDVFSYAWRSQTVEGVKALLIDFFDRRSFQNGNARIIGFQVDPADVYQGYDYENIDRQATMKPYGILRCNLDVKYYQKCRIR